MVKFLVGNKCDLEKERVVTTAEGQEFADSIGVSFLETSAKTKINIDKVFEDLAGQIHECLPESDRRIERNLLNNQNNNKKNCC